MMKTSTQPGALIKEVVSADESSEDLGEGELNFYRTIFNDLKKLKREPKDSIIDNILHYSKSL